MSHAEGMRSKVMAANIEEMQDAMNDELFLADLREVMDDFRVIDAEVGFAVTRLS